MVPYSSRSIQGHVHRWIDRVRPGLDRCAEGTDTVLSPFARGDRFHPGSSFPLDWDRSPLGTRRGSGSCFLSPPFLARRPFPGQTGPIGTWSGAKAVLEPSRSFDPPFSSVHPPSEINPTVNTCSIPHAVVTVERRSAQRHTAVRRDDDATWPAARSAYVPREPRDAEGEAARRTHVAESWGNHS